LDVLENVWTADEARRFLATVKQHGRTLQTTLFAVALDSGVRKRELLGLQWRDLDGGKLQVERQVLEKKVAKREGDTDAAWEHRRGKRSASLGCSLSALGLTKQLNRLCSSRGEADHVPRLAPYVRHAAACGQRAASRRTAAARTCEGGDHVESLRARVADDAGGCYREISRVVAGLRAAQVASLWRVVSYDTIRCGNWFPSLSLSRPGANGSHRT
jgi:integrase